MVLAVAYGNERFVSDFVNLAAALSPGEVGEQGSNRLIISPAREGIR